MSASARTDNAPGAQLKQRVARWAGKLEAQDAGQPGRKLSDGGVNKAKKADTTTGFCRRQLIVVLV